jgi:hypothetical protein
MAEQEATLVPLLAALRDLVVRLQDAPTPGMVIGGVAASLLGRPRVTRDIEALVLLDESQWAAFLTKVAEFGFVPRLSDALTPARQARVLLVRHEASGVDLDIAFGTLPFEEEAVARTVWHDVGGVRIPLPLPEDLLIMKAIAHLSTPNQSWIYLGCGAGYESSLPLWKRQNCCGILTPWSLDGANGKRHHKPSIRTALLIPSPCGCSPSMTISPKLMPMRKARRLFSDNASFLTFNSRCIGCIS